MAEALAFAIREPATTVTDQIGQRLLPGKLVAFPKGRDLATGFVRAVAPNAVRIEEDGSKRATQRKPWEVIVYGEHYRPSPQDVAA